MTVRKKTLLILIFICLLLLCYLVLSSKVVTVKPSNLDKNQMPSGNTQTKAKVDLQQVAVTHKQALGVIFSEGDQLIKEITAYASNTKKIVSTKTEDKSASEAAKLAKTEILNKISLIKNQLENLVAPATDYKDLHLDLMLSLTNLASFLETNNEKDMAAGLKLFAEAKEKYQAM